MPGTLMNASMIAPSETISGSGSVCSASAMYRAGIRERVFRPDTLVARCVDGPIPHAVSLLSTLGEVTTAVAAKGAFRFSRLDDAMNSVLGHRRLKRANRRRKVDQVSAVVNRPGIPGDSIS